MYHVHMYMVHVPVPCTHMHTAQITIFVHTYSPHGLEFADCLEIQLIFQTHSSIMLFHTT
jgi:hypothetical protein